MCVYIHIYIYIRYDVCWCPRNSLQQQGTLSTSSNNNAETSVLCKRGYDFHETLHTDVKDRSSRE